MWNDSAGLSARVSSNIAVAAAANARDEFLRTEKNKILLGVCAPSDTMKHVKGNLREHAKQRKRYVFQSSMSIITEPLLGSTGLQENGFKHKVLIKGEGVLDCLVIPVLIVCPADHQQIWDSKAMQWNPKYGHSQLIVPSSSYQSPYIYNGTYPLREDILDYECCVEANAARNNTERKRILQTRGLSGFISFAWGSTYLTSTQLFNAGDHLHAVQQGTAKRHIMYAIKDPLIFGTPTKLALLDYWLNIFSLCGITRLVTNHDMFSKMTMTGSERGDIMSVLIYFAADFANDPPTGHRFCKVLLEFNELDTLRSSKQLTITQINTMATLEQSYMLTHNQYIASLPEASKLAYGSLDFPKYSTTLEFSKIFARYGTPAIFNTGPFEQYMKPYRKGWPNTHETRRA